MNNQINDIISKLLEINEIKSIKIDTAKKLFFECLKIKNTSKETIKYYQNLFFRLDKFYSENQIDETKMINDTMLARLINECLEENLSANYINKLVSANKYLINTLAEFEYIDHVAFKITKLKETEKRISNIENDVVRKILSFIDTQSLKTKAVVYLLLDTGVRRTELVNIKLCNIDFEKCSIVLEHTKTNQVRPCFFTDKSKDILLDYIKAYKPKIYLFENERTGTHLKAHSISTLLNKIKVCLDLDKLSAHQFRHTFGTNIYNSSLDIEFTRELLGHTTYQMTKRYIHNSKDKLKEKYLKHNPSKSYSK